MVCLKPAFFFPVKKKVARESHFRPFCQFFHGHFFAFFTIFHAQLFFFSRVILWFLMVFSRAKNRFHGQKFDFFSREIFVFRHFYFFTGKFSGKIFHGQFLFFHGHFFQFFSRARFFFTGKILGFFTGKVLVFTGKKTLLHGNYGRTFQ